MTRVLSVLVAKAAQYPRKRLMNPLPLSVGTRAISAREEAFSCDRVTSARGNDANPATQAAPVRTASKPTSLLAPGQRGCLTGGQMVVEGSNVFVTGLNLRGLGSIADTNPRIYHPGIDGDAVRISGNDISTPHGTCVDVGGSDACGEVAAKGHRRRAAGPSFLARSPRILPAKGGKSGEGGIRTLETA